MTPDEHAAKAAEIAELAKALYDAEDQAGGDVAVTTLGEVQALAAVAQVHATLALRQPPERTPDPLCGTAGVEPNP